MNRRRFLLAAAGLAAPAASMPILDTHIHLFDPRRPQGVPWPSRANATLYRPALPERYRRIAVPLGITGAIAVECSPWLEDNQWLLDVAAREEIVVGVVGNLEPGRPGFRAHLDRFQRNPLFRGIRYGNLWGRNLGAELANPEFIAGLRALAGAGLALDTANPTLALIEDVLRLADRVPALRIVVDHLAQLTPFDPAALRELGLRPHIFVKVSAVLRRVDGRVPTELSFYRHRLDTLREIFGPDRLFYGSDWPNSDQWAPYPQVLALVREYFTAQGPAAAERFFWKNAQAVYFPPQSR